VRPVLELDGSVGAGGDVAWGVGDAVALMTGLDLGDVSHDLLLEEALDGRVLGMSVICRRRSSRRLTVVIGDIESNVPGIISDGKGHGS